MSAAAARVDRNRSTAADAARLLAGVHSDRPVAYDEHHRLHGQVPDVARRDHDALIRVVARSGLTGRGGACFPVARKLEAVSDGRRPVVVANGAEGEPTSGKDKMLLVHTPHLVLDGVVLAARATGAREAIVATASKTAYAALAHALAERRDRAISIRRVLVPDRFVAGEETALVQYLNGGPALPTFTPPRPFERGVAGAPTLVQNVETLAHLALIARHGADWFRAVGTHDEPGSALVTLSGAVRAPAVYEVPLGLPLEDLLRRAGGVTSEVQAFLVGGYFGTWIGAAEAHALRLANADLARLGGSLGARAIVALPDDACGIRETARVTRYLAGESAGQCGPCVHGLAAVADDLERLVGRKRVDVERLGRRLGVIDGRGACSHPDGATRFVASALRVFSSDVDRHAHGRACGSRPPQLPIGEHRR